jgi:hypothetical protein
LTVGTKKTSSKKYSVWKNEAKIFSMDLSKSSKHLKIYFLPNTKKIEIGPIVQIAALLGLPDFHQQANKSITLLGITQYIPKRVKMLFHKAEATSQWRRRWFTDFSSLLNKQHLSIMMICLCLRLSTVRILHRATDHAKKAALEGAWVRHTLFQGKHLPSKQAKEMKKDLTLNNPFLEETHQSLSAQSLLTMAECNTWNKEAKTPTSQSCASLTKLTFYWVASPKTSILSAIEVSFTQTIPKRLGKTSFVSPHHKSCQKFVLTPSPISNLAKPKKVSHPFLMFFHNPTPKAPTSSREHHRPQKLPNLGVHRNSPPSISLNSKLP